MPSLNDVIEEITALQKSGNDDAVDIVRDSKAQDIFKFSNRNVICYYSGWLTSNGKGNPNFSIDDMDKNGFMNSIHGMDCTLGLDLILHTPGGSITAAESLVYYLKQKFGSDIRVIIPQMAMSSGTMIACCAKEIVMGHQSCIGPFDPFVKGVSAFAVFDEFKRASEEIEKKPHTIPLWQTMVQKYPPAFLEECDKAIALARTIVPGWLEEGMFHELQDEDARRKTISNIMKALNNPESTKEHSRHIHFKDALDLGLNVRLLEDDQEFQELVLTLHHAYMATLLLTNTSKFIESHHGKRFILT